MEGHDQPFEAPTEEEQPLSEYADSDGESESQQQSSDIIENADVEFEVEGRVLKANRGCLCMISPVFKVMLKGVFKETLQSRIPLPGKLYNDMLEFLEVTHLGKSVDEDNAETLLHLANEYECKVLLAKCEEKLLKKAGSFDMLSVANKYGLHQLREKGFEILSNLSFQDMKDSGYKCLGLEEKVQFLEDKVQKEEEKLSKLKKLESMIERMKNIQSTPLKHVVCSENALRLFKVHYRNNWECYRHEGYASTGAGYHIAATECKSCLTCIAFIYIGLVRVLREI